MSLRDLRRVNLPKLGHSWAGSSARGLGTLIGGRLAELFQPSYSPLILSHFALLLGEFGADMVTENANFQIFVLKRQSKLQNRREIDCFRATDCKPRLHIQLVSGLIISAFKGSGARMARRAFQENSSGSLGFDFPSYLDALMALKSYVLLL